MSASIGACGFWLDEVRHGYYLEMTNLELLRQIVSDIRRGDFGPGMTGTLEIDTLYTKLGIRRGKLLIRPVPGCIGIGDQGVTSISDLTSSLRQNEQRLREGVSEETLRTKIFDLVLAAFSERMADGIEQADYSRFKTELQAWFVQVSLPRVHLVPCLIVPYKCDPFSVGPVSFWHSAEFYERIRHLGVEFPTTPDIVFEIFLNSMKSQSASWVAEVVVPGREHRRSSEIADLAVDLALTALQLFIPESWSTHFSRMTARSQLSERHDLSLTSMGVSSGSSNLTPGLGLLPGPFNTGILQAAKLLESVGRRLDYFINDSVTLSGLQQGWCDAAYWFHEGVAESLDTVAVAKLETAIEQLMSAGSTSGNKRRLVLALRAFYGLEKDQLLFRGASMTVGEFIEKIAQARSRVLHGTESTLTGEVAETRNEISIFARDVLLKYTLALDRYSASVSSDDHIESFLVWVEDQRIHGNNVGDL
jgi:hypothetical protein